MAWTRAQLDQVQIDHGLIYMDYGLATQKQLGPTRGGGEFVATANIRNIEFDGALGKTKGMQVIDEINASLKVTMLNTSLETLSMGLPQAEYTVDTIINSGVGGVIPDAKYIANITMFAKLAGGKYKKITLKNAMHEGDLSIKAAPKDEAEIALEFFAHWDATKDPAVGDLYTIEDIDAIAPPPGS